MLDLSRGAGVDAAAAVRAQDFEQWRVAIRLEGVVHVVGNARRIERPAQPPEVLTHAPRAINIGGRAFGGEGREIVSTECQPAILVAQIGALPPTAAVPHAGRSTASA